MSSSLGFAGPSRGRATKASRGQPPTAGVAHRHGLVLIAGQENPLSRCPEPAERTQLQRVRFGNARAREEADARANLFGPFYPKDAPTSPAPEETDVQDIQKVNPKVATSQMAFEDPLQFWSIFSAAMNENPPMCWSSPSETSTPN